MLHMYSLTDAVTLCWVSTTCQTLLWYWRPKQICSLPSGAHRLNHWYDRWTLKSHRLHPIEAYFSIKINKNIPGQQVECHRVIQDFAHPGYQSPLWIFCIWLAGERKISEDLMGDIHRLCLEVGCLPFAHMLLAAVQTHGHSTVRLGNTG